MNSNQTSQSVGKRKKGELRLADEHAISRILQDNYSIWSPGLSPDAYRHYIQYQFALPWGRRNLRYWNYVLDREPVSSCKIYNIPLQSRSKQYRVAGIGAVFTPERHRGNSYATRMLELVIDRCRKNNFDALLLYSDIGTEFYEKLGFELLGDSDFRFALEPNSIPADRVARSLDLTVRLLAQSDLENVIRMYDRELCRSAYGVKRDLAYLQFKTLREAYVFAHSKLSWPKLEIMAVDLERDGGGYALFEQGGKVLRLLELVGPEAIKMLIWQELLELAQKREITLIRGWESALPPYVKAPKNQRDWSHCMLLPLNKVLAKLADCEPCPIYELDHF